MSMPRLRAPAIISSIAAFAHSHAGDVDDVNRRAGDGGIGDHFLKRIDDPRFDRPAERIWTKTVALRSAAMRNTSRISARVAIGT